MENAIEKKKPSKLKILTNGLIKENPTLVLVLGTCPTLAVTTQAFNGIGMGLAATAVLVCSNIFISLLKNIIPDKVRIPCYIVVIAAFVTIVQFLLQAYMPALNDALGLFIPLIVVNCIILGRAEMFANKNSVIDSALDGIGMGLGFTLALFCMGTIREILGSGTWFGMQIIPESVAPITIMKLAPGGFFVFGCLMALMNKLTKGKPNKNFELGCAGCALSAVCGHVGAELPGCEADLAAEIKKAEDEKKAKAEAAKAAAAARAMEAPMAAQSSAEAAMKVAEKVKETVDLGKKEGGEA